MQRNVSGLSTAVAGPALCHPIAPLSGRETGKTAMMKIQPRTESQHRRIPAPEMGLAWGAEESVDKGRKHEAFDTGFYSGERRGLARALRFDRKR
jgi:hypothetical protein